MQKNHAKKPCKKTMQKTMPLKLFNICTSLSLIVYLLVFSDSSVAIAAPSVSELTSICEAAREKLIAPLRQQAIEECTTETRNPPKYCQQYYSDYGNAGRTQDGFRQRLFHDIPECLAVYEAEAQARGDSSLEAEPETKPDGTAVGNHRDTEPGKSRDADP